MMEEGGDESIEPSNAADDDPESNLNDGSSKTLSQASATLPRRKWSSLLLHASIMCGREFLYAVEVVLVTPIILQLGMPEKYYSFMWCFSPIIGLLVGPIIGSQSDQCTCRFGRRRPFIFGLGLGAIIGLTLLIFSKDIATVLGGSNSESQRLWGIVIGILGAQGMDFCVDQAETPVRAYTLDVCSPQDQPKAFALQTVFIGIGGALGFIIDGIDWEETAVSYLVDSQIKVVYIFAVFVYLITTVCNLLSIKEVPFVKGKVLSAQVTRIANHATESKVPLVRISKSVQNSHNTDSMIDLASETEMNQKISECVHSSKTTPSISVPPYDEADIHTLEVGKRLPVSLLGWVAMSKGLYISTSCPGGLNEEVNIPKDSLTSFTTSNPACNEDLQEKADELSFSLPSLIIKDKKSVNHGKNLLDAARMKRFSNGSKNVPKEAYLPASVELTAVNAENENSELMLKDKYRTKCTNSNTVIDFMDASTSNLLEVTEHQRNTAVFDDIARKNGVVRKLEYLEQEESLLQKSNSRINEGKCKRKRKKKSEDHTLSFRQLWLSIVTMPVQLRWLCLVQLLGFVGIETLILWYTDLMGRVVYGGNPKAPSNSTELANYNAGVKMGCWGLTVYSLAMVIFSVIMEHFHLLSKFSIRFIYSFTSLLVTVVMGIMFAFTSKWVILIFSWCVGVSIAVLLTVPFVLVGKYHQDKEYVKQSPGKTCRGLGLDCAILACQMYAGNIVSATISSPIIHAFGTVKAMLLTTGFCFFLAFIFAYFCVSYPNEKDICCKRTNSEE